MKAKNLIEHPRLQGVPHVKLANTQTAFWRYHTRGTAEEGVCTVECIYYFLKTLMEQGKLHRDGTEDKLHMYDDLLWYFAYQHRLIHAAAVRKYEARASAPPRDQQPAGKRTRKRKRWGKEIPDKNETREGIATNGGATVDAQGNDDDVSCAKHADA